MIIGVKMSSTIKSFSVGNGDMFYIIHENKTLTLIDCNILKELEKDILKEINEVKEDVDFNRFISTHPDEDHIRGIKLLDEKIGINNFYSVDNNIKTEDSDDFRKYYELRDNSDLKLKKDMENSWLNKGHTGREGSDIFILWPDINNEDYKEELNKLEKNEKISGNNISPIIQYSPKNSVSVLWFGDMENDFLNKIEKEIEIPEADILFAPHHGRDSGKIPENILKKIKPKIIIIGEGDPEDLNYYPKYNTITQNTAKNIVLECELGKIHIYTAEKFKCNFLDKDNVTNKLSTGEIYRGTLNLKKNR